MKNLISPLVLVLILFSSCQKRLTEKDKKDYISNGKEFAQASAEHLGSQLTKSMKEGGVAKAVPFCNTMAMPLTNQMSEKYNSVIKRTSLKVRNENNKANDEELKILNSYQNDIEENKQLKPIVELDKLGKPHFYAPIILQKKCLACHGEKGENMAVKTDSIIRSYYPNDLATGFKEGDLRGIWSISFESE